MINTSLLVCSTLVCSKTCSNPKALNNNLVGADVDAYGVRFCEAATSSIKEKD